MPTSVRCDQTTKRGRLVKAKQFYEAAAIVTAGADDDHDVIDACVTLLVHAGIAAADVLCCEHLGRHAQGADHRAAIDLLARVDERHARDLRTLLGLKTHAGYSAMLVTAAKRTQAFRAAQRLVTAAAAV